ncbi:MAG: hypothetical protein U0R19_26820 [Bryobacteraceae bacterium]
MRNPIELPEELLERAGRAAAMTGVSVETFVSEAVEIRLRAFSAELAIREEADDEMFA